MIYTLYGAFLVAQQVKNPPASRSWSYPWVGKIPWRRAWQPTPVFLPGESHGLRSLVGYSLWGCKESDMTECLSTHIHTHHIQVNTHQLLLYSVLHSISTFLKFCLYPFSPLSCLSCSFSPTSVRHFLLIFNHETHCHDVINDLHLAKPLINHAPLLQSGASLVIQW